MIGSPIFPAQRAKNGVGLQIEDHDGAVAASVADKPTPDLVSERDTMGVFLARDICQGLAGLGVYDHGVGGARNI